MITEDYCSYEVAKLLKEKGFNAPCWFAYTTKVERVFCKAVYLNSDIEYARVISDGEFSCPTHQMAMKWLREKHNLCISVYAAACRHGFTIDHEDSGSFICNEDVVDADPKCMEYTYEEAVEAALKYCLTNLI